MLDMPAQIGPYTITREIGRGGMGVVYLARDTKLDRDVAIKALPPELAEDADRLARFEREAKTLAQLNHPNVAGIHGIEEQDGHKYLILEYVEGATLAERLDAGPLALDEALDVCIQIAAGIEAAHEAGIVHRDLKPDNIKITHSGGEGKVKVLDFGLARSDEGASSSSGDHANSPTIPSPAQHSPTIPGAILGTAAYMSPEQARGRPVDKRTDIWSFGAILYEMLTGIGPFHGETASDSIGAVLHKEIDFDRLPREAPPMVRHVLHRCLERDRNRRLRDIGDVRLELEMATATEIGAVDGRPARGPSALIGAVIGALIMALAAGGVFLTIRPESDAGPVRRLDLGVPGGVGTTLEMPVISPDGARIVYRQNDRLWVRELSRYDARELAGTEGATEPFWSPDGLWIGFAQGDHLMKIRADGGRSERIATMRSAMPRSGGVAWLADGTIVFATGNDALFSVPSGGGRPEIWLPLTENDEDFHDVAPLPDGRGVVFISHTKVGPWKVCVADGSTRADVVDAFTLRTHSPVYSVPGFIIYHQRAPNAGLWAVPFDLDSFSTTGKPFLIAGDATRPSASSDGTLAYLRNSADQDYVLTWLPIDGGPVETIGEPMSTVTTPAMSPDGSRIAHPGGNDGNEIVVYDIASDRRSVISHGLEGVREPSWSPDGDLIAVTYDVGPERRLSFFKADGTGKVGDDIDCNWASFDETWTSAALERTGPEGNRGDIWFVSLDGSGTERPLIATPADEDWARVSPDGQWLCYSSDETGTEEFYLTRYPSGEGRWQITNGGGSTLEWGPEGDRVYYDRPEDFALMEVTLDLDDGVRIGAPRRLWSREDNGVLFFQGYEVPPPGDRVLGVTYERIGNATPSIGIVQNWYEEFRNR